MTRKLIDTLRPTPQIKGQYELKVETPQGQVKTLIGTNFDKLFQEVKHIADSNEPTPT